MMRKRTAKGERGAAAVEFALILPVLLLLVLGIIEFGRIYNIQISLSGAAREGARYMAIHHSETNAATNARNSAVAAAPSVPLTAGSITISNATCATGTQVSVTVPYTVTLISGYLGFAPINLTGKGVMQCGG